MQPITEAYPTVSYESDYKKLLETIAPVAVMVSDKDYQGDSSVLLADPEGRIGYLRFGWGSCSGCDALQACNTHEELEKLRNELAEQVRWFLTVDDFLKFVGTHDWKGQYTFKEASQFCFLAIATVYATQSAAALATFVRMAQNGFGVEVDIPGLTDVPEVAAELATNA